MARRAAAAVLRGEEPSRLTRGFDPVKAIDVETINGEPALKSAYARVLTGQFAATREVSGLRLRRRY